LKALERKQRLLLIPDSLMNHELKISKFQKTKKERIKQRELQSESVESFQNSQEELFGKVEYSLEFEKKYFHEIVDSKKLPFHLFPSFATLKISFSVISQHSQEKKYSETHFLLTFRKLLIVQEVQKLRMLFPSFKRKVGKEKTRR
jgi:hypothetical protein